MTIVITGGTGFLGRALAHALTANGHEVVVLTREARDVPGTRAVAWTPDGRTGAWASAIAGADAVVNLAGESTAKPWTAKQKHRIPDSPVHAQRSRVSPIPKAHSTPSGCAR